MQAVIGNLGLEPEADGSLVLYRRISAEGKSSCKINGAPCTVTMLRAVGNALVNIHGQHDSQTLLDRRHMCTLWICWQRVTAP